MFSDSVSAYTPGGGSILDVNADGQVDSADIVIRAMATHEGLRDEDLFVLVPPRTPVARHKEQ